MNTISAIFYLFHPGIDARTINHLSSLFNTSRAEGNGAFLMPQLWFTQRKRTQTYRNVNVLPRSLAFGRLYEAYNGRNVVFAENLKVMFSTSCFYCSSPSRAEWGIVQSTKLKSNFRRQASWWLQRWPCAGSSSVAFSHQPFFFKKKVRAFSFELLSGAYLIRCSFNSSPWKSRYFI